MERFKANQEQLEAMPQWAYITTSKQASKRLPRKQKD